MTSVRRAAADDAEVLGRLLWDFNTEFESETDDADVLAVRFARLLGLDEIVAVLAEDDVRGAVGFALLSLRPAIWFDGPVSAARGALRRARTCARPRHRHAGRSTCRDA